MNRHVLAGVVLLVSAFAAAAPAGAATSSIVIGAPQVGVAANGSAVVAWSGPVSVFASTRPAGGRFATGNELSSGRTARDPSLGVNRRGDAVVAWHRADRDGRPKGAVFVSRRAAGRAFGPSVAVPGSGRGFAPAVGVSNGGDAVVAFLRTESASCGAAVFVAVARSNRAFGRARRVSPRCAHAADVRATLWSGADGIVVWRAGRVLKARIVEDGRRGAGMKITSGPIATVGYDLAPSSAGAVVTWRAGADGPVLAAGLQYGGVRGMQALSAQGARIAGAPQIDVRRNAVAVAWQEGVVRPRVVVATRAAGTSAFTPAEVADPCGAIDASRSYANPVWAGTAPAVVFQSGCMNRFGLGPDYGIALTVNGSDGAWSPQPLSGGRYSAGTAVGASDAGEIVAAWNESGSDGSGGLRTAFVTPR